MADVQCEPYPESDDGIDWSKPYIFMWNHQSFFDIVIAFITTPQNIRFVAKRVLKSVPFLGWYMWATGMIFVDRSNREQAIKSLAAAGKLIRAGASILAFPEGTRSRDGRVSPFKKGPFVVALQAQVPIVPVAIEGSGAVLPRGGWRARPGRIRVKFGVPIPTAGLSEADRDQLMHRVREAIIDLQARALAGRAATRPTRWRRWDARARAPRRADWFFDAPPPPCYAELPPDREDPA